MIKTELEIKTRRRAKNWEFSNHQSKEPIDYDKARKEHQTLENWQ